MKRTILAGLSALLISCSSTPKYDTTSAKVQLAQCLVEKEAVMYGTFWCGYCKKEKEEFGKEAWKVMQQNYVECEDESNEAKCEEDLGKSMSLPSWKFKDGKIIRGYTPNFLELSAKESGCD